jgi:alkyl hydroperoxide reductase subunit AhpC
VIGISGGDGSSKAKFCSKYKLNVPLVSDTDFKVAKSFGAYGDKKFMGRSFKGIFRKTFILDSKGTVVKVFESVKPEGHATEVLKAIDAMTRTGGTTKKAVAKKAATKKTPVKKAPVKKAPVKKATVKKATAKRTPAQTKAAPSSRKATARAAKTSSRKKK